MTWRAMQACDLKEVAAISDVVHGAYTERPSVYAERLVLYPDGCFVLMEGGVRGYAIAHPWPTGCAVPLDTLIGDIPERADGFYLHDLALQPSARGHGAAKAAIALIEATARAGGFRTLSLVAVNGAEAFWARHGFAPVRQAPLPGYGEQARYMRRSL